MINVNPTTAWLPALGLPRSPLSRERSTPAGHVVQDVCPVEPWKLPAPQLEGEVIPVLGHLWPVVHVVGEDRPVVGQKLPAGHVVGDVSVVPGQKLPANTHPSITCGVWLR